MFSKLVAINKDLTFLLHAVLCQSKSALRCVCISLQGCVETCTAHVCWAVSKVITKLYDNCMYSTVSHHYNLPSSSPTDKKNTVECRGLTNQTKS